MKNSMVMIDLCNHGVYEFTFTAIGSPALDSHIKLGLNHEDESFNLQGDSRHISTRSKVDPSKLCVVIDED
jgi:hypothetical protein